jgi:hypothetical protein
MRHRIQVLGLDFQSQPAAKRRRNAMWALLALLLALAPVVYRQHLLTEAGSLDRMRLARAEPATPSRATARLQAAGGDSNAKWMRQIGLPWESLFNGLEAATSGQVVLLSVQPNARQGSAILTGEAGRYSEVMQYIERLKAQPEFRQAFLTNHAIAEEEPGKPVRFTILLQWGDAK